MTNVIDLEHLERYICGDAGLRAEVLAIFDEQAAMLIGQLDPCQDDTSWYDGLHALKGASRGVGAWAVGDLCEQGEALVAGAPEKVSKRRVLLAELAENLNAALAEARGLRDCA